MTTKSDQALSYFEQGFSCPQSVLATYAEQLGLDLETALKISSGFAGGMGRMGETCGAVTGAFMVIGLKFGPATPDDAEARQRTFELVRKFAQTFKSANPSLLCKELLGFDVSTPEGKEAAKQPGAYDPCQKIIKNAVEILESIIGE